MRTFQVSLERNGIMAPVGTIAGNDSNDARFCYLSEYVHDVSSTALSISMPIREEPYSAMQTAAFFEGLLPEGFTRRSLAQWMHVDEEDYLSILHRLGRECLGAICITEENEELASAYERITEEQVRELAAEGVKKSAEIVTQSHLSLTGASGKVGLYYRADQDEWFLPLGIAPSTHIVKQSHVRLDNIVTNEQLSLLTAARCGIRIPHSFIVNTGNGEDHEVLFATERYDRVISADSGTICGLPRPFRLHQEDFAQAMGIPTIRKYEQDNDGYMNGMFDILRKFSSDPITDQIRLWDMLVFDFLIGNTDAHLKNFSLLYGTNLKSVRLAPVYDIVSTTVYEHSTRDMAFSIGGVYSIDDLDEDNFIEAARSAGLGRGMAKHRFELMRSRFPEALAQSAEDLLSIGYPKAFDLKERILQSGGIRKCL